LLAAAVLFDANIC